MRHDVAAWKKAIADQRNPPCCWTAEAMLVRRLVPVYRVFDWCFPGRQNLFAAKITKHSIPQDVHPWLMQQDGKIVFNRDWSPGRSAAGNAT